VEVIYDPALVFLIMEYCANGELYQYIVQNGRLMLPVTRKIFRQLVEGMVYIHARDIAHRDLKLENILLDDEMNAKIIDFGFAHEAAQSSLLDTPCGTLLYASPELLMRQKYDGKLSDVWSLGVVLFAMATGSLPWSASGQAALIHQIIAGNFTIPGFVTPEIRSLIERMMQADPALRPTMEDIAQDAWVARTEFPGIPIQRLQASLAAPNSAEKRFSAANQKRVIVRPELSVPSGIRLDPVAGGEERPRRPARIIPTKLVSRANTIGNYLTLK
jgi:serine/threonine protein kinase